VDFNGRRLDLDGIAGKRHRRRHTIANFRGGWVCHFCGCDVECAVCDPDTETAANIDHVSPKSRGGSDTVENSVISCILCNEAKGDAAWPDPVLRAKLALKLDTSGAFFNGSKLPTMAVA
jgi:5-methylcytosine-specific restriction endonuclease McrA